ncbi:MAG: 3-phosphoshikimate 1-carboxyvinyltransferase [Coxiella sp. (in: Bacteria)]|nr:MAG: 3-phosphoshikimate 1-carboxyvinyltransferase [Coxiella sp. (in: g-proteobacteria)]
MHYKIAPTHALKGQITVPGDKSISHRAVMLGSIASGVTHVTGFLNGADNIATIQCMRNLGVSIEEVSATELIIHGVGMHGLKTPTEHLDCGNAGTAIRLMTGLLAAQSFDSVLTGDEYLLKRPMKRITDPLGLMHAHIETTVNGTAPLEITGGQQLQGITYNMPVASAQVKSCLLLAGIYAQGDTTIVEPGVTRDHTERMLRAMGYPVETNGASISITEGYSLMGCDIQVPADISSAAFFMVAAAITPNSKITLHSVGINPTRDGVLQILELMGARIEVSNQRVLGEEPVADITVHSSTLTGIDIPQSLVPLAIDEFPVLMIAAACATGKTVLHGAKELRVKETDRIAAMAEGLKTLGIEVEVFDDGMSVVGGQLKGGNVDSFGDHRIAMSFAIAGCVAADAVTVTDCDNVATSFPGFAGLVTKLGGTIKEESNES